ncbi:MAG: FAD-binding oxidoreductase, partial [Kiloniellales bacterium]
LFIGAEGTLGIVTAAVLQLFALPAQRATAMVAVGTVEAAVELLSRARAAAGDVLDCVELLSRRGLEFSLKHVPDTADPLSDPHPWYLLIELATGDSGRALGEVLEALLAEAYEDGLVRDAAIAASEGQARDFWRLREELSEAQKKEGGSIKHDISVPISEIPRFLARATALVERMIPGVRPVPFGHLGDGNLHFNLSQPEGADREAFMARWEEINRAVHEIVVEMGGSISAEHGIGRLMVAENKHFKSAVEIELMARVKAALDPGNIMNPGKVL